ncbi:hypothetical protein CDAR_256851 [Caerostris darwini]|uniref:Uncharacterized protein n=1 Tax=Caerostris darwini TaxID=1538125 RepID=A0AAV4PZY3_9ARAC|nr:hypothetical protein CDAR_256851 [Caerostris darwini]
MCPQASHKRKRISLNCYRRGKERFQIVQLTIQSMQHPCGYAHCNNPAGTEKRAPDRTRGTPSPSTELRRVNASSASLPGRGRGTSASEPFAGESCQSTRSIISSIGFGSRISRSLSDA